MQEEKNRTTPGQKTERKHHHRRKKSAAVKPQPAVQETDVAAPSEETAPKETETKQEPAGAAPSDVEAEISAPAENEEKKAEPSAEKAETEMPQKEPEPSEPERTEESPETPEQPEPAEAAEPVPEEADSVQNETTEPSAPAAEAEPSAPDVETTAQEKAEAEAAEEPSDTDKATGTESVSAPESGQSSPEEAETPEDAEPSEPENASAEQAAETVAETVEATPEESAEEQSAEAEAEPEKENAEATSGENSEEVPQEDEQRLSDMTRTVQLSVEQIMARVSEESAEELPESEPEPSESDDGAEETPDTLQDNLRSGLSSMAKWLLLVAFIVLVIAGFGVAWLYRSATPDMLPQITAKFAGQTLEPTAYKWKVPVVGNIFKRTYADTFSSTPVELSETVDQVSPDFVISPSDYRTEVTVIDASENVIFEGDTDTFSSFQFTANGTYTAKLVVHGDASSVPGDTSVTGSETWYFTFTVGVRPSVRLSGTTVDQGSVVAVRVGDTLDGQAPTLQTELQNPGFFKASSGWVCYIPIAWNQPAGTQTVTVSAGGYTETLEFKVRAADWEYKDYSSNSQRVSPYIGQNDIPAELQKLLAQSEKTVAWSNGGFVQPFLNTLDVKLAFGTTEYVGRSYSQRSTNNGAGGRTVTNLVLNTKSGELLIAPASGTVLLAKDLGGDFGYTVVIDHGAGVKSIFYNLEKVNVKAGDAVKQGQTLATCGKTTVAEMRIGAVPVDPLQVWRGQCDALKNY